MTGRADREQNAARMAEISDALAATRAAEEAECLKMMENCKAAAGARLQQGRAFRHASRHTAPAHHQRAGAAASLRMSLPRWAGGGVAGLGHMGPAFG